MRLGEVMASVHTSGQRPWYDAPSPQSLEIQKNKKQRAKRKQTAKAHREELRRTATDEVRSLLSDLRWHHKAEVRAIGKRYGVGVESIIDHAGGYPQGDYVISARADV